MNEKRMTKELLLILSTASGICVASIYYVQPLLGSLAEFLSISEPQAGVLATCTQLGYALGLFLILPAADILNKKKLVLSVLIFSVVSLITMSLSRNYFFMLFICILIGFTSVTPQLLVPFGAMLSEPHERGKNIGMIMSGLMTGILVSRVFSGLMGSYLGWQAVYICAAAAILALIFILKKTLPNTGTPNKTSYMVSIKSMFKLPRKYPILLAAMINGSLLFAVFCAFWAVLTFYLESKAFGFNSDIIGLFGLFGIAGAAMGPIAGKMSDKKGVHYTVFFHLIVTLIAISVLGILGKSLFGIILGTILLDYGIQCCNVSNQARIQALSDAERNRITAVYMVTFFIGGAAGSLLGTLFYDFAGWIGFVFFGIICVVIAFAAHIWGGRNIRHNI